MSRGHRHSGRRPRRRNPADYAQGVADGQRARKGCRLFALSVLALVVGLALAIPAGVILTAHAIATHLEATP